MDMDSPDFLLKKIESFTRRKDISEPLKYLCDKLPAQADFYIAGGALRNVIIEIVHGYRPEILDIDVMIGNLRKEFSISNVLAQERYRFTDFGGVRWFPKDSAFSLDLSLLENFLPIKKFHLAPTLENLLKTIDFNVNAVIYDFKDEALHERFILKTIRKKRVGFNSGWFYDKLLLAYRLLVIRHKINFYFSEQAFKFIRDSIAFDSVNALMNIMIAKLGKTEAERIIDEYDRICVYKSYEEYITAEHL